MVYNQFSHLRVLCLRIPFVHFEAKSPIFTHQSMSWVSLARQKPLSTAFSLLEAVCLNADLKCGFWFIGMIRRIHRRKHHRWRGCILSCLRRSTLEPTSLPHRSGTTTTMRPLLSTHSTPLFQSERPIHSPTPLNSTQLIESHLCAFTQPDERQASESDLIEENGVTFRFTEWLYPKCT